MGKGYNNYMSKKFFHPTNPENMRRVFMAEEKARHAKKQNEEMIAQYRREQDTLEHRAMLGDKKAQMGLSFMYDAPAGLRKEEEETTKEEPKFEWQRKYNAPRESWAKGNEEITDQPFGIEVRNLRCIRCHNWGHSNTDRICPLFGQDLTMEPPNPREGESISELKEQLQEQGLALKKGVFGHRGTKGQDLVSSSDSDEPDAGQAFLSTLTPKQREKLLKQVAALQGKKTKHKKEKKKKKTKKKKHISSSSDSDGDSKRTQKRRHSSSDEESPVKHRHREEDRCGTSRDSGARSDSKKERSHSSKYRGHESSPKSRSSGSSRRDYSPDRSRSHKHERRHR